jgi:hypothetical protein
MIDMGLDCLHEKIFEKSFFVDFVDFELWAKLYAIFCLSTSFEINPNKIQNCINFKSRKILGSIISLQIDLRKTS